MKKVTAATVFTTAQGIRISIVYSEISDDGVIIKDNARVDRILTAREAIIEAEALTARAQEIIDKLD